MIEFHGRPVTPDEKELYQCQNCSSLWRVEDLHEVRDWYDRFDDGDRMTHYECPDRDCAALCFPADGKAVTIELGLSQLGRIALRAHVFHEVRIMGVPGEERLVCCECGNNDVHVIPEDEISKITENPHEG